MLDAILRRQSETFLAPVAARVAALGIGANALTLSAAVCGIVAVLDIGHRYYLIGLAALVLGRVFDALDGAVARRAGPTASGATLDLVLDLVVAAAIPFSFALAQPDHALAAMFLMLGLVARAGASVAVRQTGWPGESLDQAGGLIGKTELFLAFALACVFPNWFSIIAYAVGILCFIAAGSRTAAILAKP